MDIGERIKLLREQHNMTLEQLGDKVGVGKSTIRKWETGMIANMRRDKIKKLADALNTTPDYLMGWDEEERINQIIIEEQQIKAGLEVTEIYGFEHFHMIEVYELLPEEGRQALLEYTDFLINKYNISDSLTTKEEMDRREMQKWGMI